MKFRLAPLLLAAVAIAPAVQAQAGLDIRMRDQLRQTILELRQLQDENATLKAKLAAAPAAPTRNPDSEARLQRVLAEAGRQGNRSQELEQQLTAAQGQLAALQRQLGDGTAALRASQEREKQLGTQGTELKTRGEQCEARNVELLGISRELIGRYRDRGFLDVLLSREPLLGLRRVELEKLAQTYQGRVREQSPPPAISP